MPTWVIIVIFGGIGVAWAWFILTRTDKQMAELAGAGNTNRTNAARDESCPFIVGVGYIPGTVDPELYIHE